MVGVCLLIDKYEAGVSISASRSVNALMRGVIPEVVDPRDTFELGNLLAGRRVKDDQDRWVASAAEKPMMGLVERQGGNKRSPHGPGGNLFALRSINHARLGQSSKRHENSRSRFLDLDATGTGIRLDVPNMFITTRVDNGQRSGFGIGNANSDIKVFCRRVVPHVIWICAKR